MGKLNKIVKREEITVGYKCNIQCKFCFYGCSPNDSLKNIVEIKKNILLAKRYGIEHIDLSGGEPTLHPDIGEIIEFCRIQNFKTICLITNGLILKDIAKMDYLKNKGLNQFVFSLHSAFAKTHNYLTGAQTFDNILQSIKNAQQLGIVFRINIVVNKINFRELVEMTQLMLEIKPLIVNYLIYSPLGVARNFAHEMSAKYSDIFSEIAKAVGLLKDHMEVRIRYIPFCLAQGYEKYICNIHQIHYDFYEWDYLLREHIHNGLMYKWVKIIIGLGLLPLKRLFQQKLRLSFYEALMKTKSLLNATKPIKCRACKYCFICDGVWRNYAAIYGVAELKPIAGRKIMDPSMLMINAIR